MRTSHVIAALCPPLAFVMAPNAWAQVTIDVAKINCRQFVEFKITDPEHIALWISGYYHGKRGDTVVEAERLKSMTQDVKSYCYSHPDELVLRAVEMVVGGAAQK